ncbi:transmembrane glucosamine N-acetyltransferase NagX [Shewanella algae]|uniref:transmembrane glucosamine N-acetyltransferase NagX n=1 Tax=Shewanella algae TaxID=38313 RepID=UPI000D1A48FF|nr:DUF5009 domain-containing protein [Shewanella algae]PSS68534.1 amino acid transporter [Shewanella algae]
MTEKIAAATETANKPRLMSLDALRGFDMFWILGGEALFAALLLLTTWSGWRWFDGQMHHSSWHGFTFYDLIFPLFIFLSGVALGLSPKRLDKLAFAERLPKYKHAVKRLALLLFFGVLYNHGWGTGMPAALDEIRYASVLGRIAFAWFFAAMLVWHTGLRTQIYAAVAILLGYAMVQLWLPVPGGSAGDFSAAGSINAWVDSHFLPGISYQHKPHDPEGLLSTLPAVVNALAGVFVGRFLQQQSFSAWGRVGLLCLAGLVCLGLGWLLNPLIPVNKDLWTSSFVLVSSGWSLLLLALFYAVIDVLGLRWLGFPFVVIGCNAIIIYLASSLVQWRYSSESLFGGFINSAPENWQPLLGVLAMLGVQWLLLWWMYRRRLFIRV